MIPVSTFVGLALTAALGGSVALASSSETNRSSEQIYVERCAFCHSRGGWGTRTLARRLPENEAVLLDRADLPPAYTTFVVRYGVGAMPQFNPSELTDAELEELSRWLEDRN